MILPVKSATGDGLSGMREKSGNRPAPVNAGRSQKSSEEDSYFLLPAGPDDGEVDMDLAAAKRGRKRRARGRGSFATGASMR